jgi:hypothetical protein
MLTLWPQLVKLSQIPSAEKHIRYELQVVLKFSPRTVKTGPKVM